MPNTNAPDKSKMSISSSVKLRPALEALVRLLARQSADEWHRTSMDKTVNNAKHEVHNEREA